MSNLQRERRPEGPVVTGFSAQGFRIEDQEFTNGLWLTPEWARDWIALELEALDHVALAELLEFQPIPEFLILGTGETLRRPAPAIIEAIEKQGIGVEIMDSRAAARAWGVLRAEDRWIVAALLPIG